MLGDAEDQVVGDLDMGHGKTHLAVGQDLRSSGFEGLLTGTLAGEGRFDLGQEIVGGKGLGDDTVDSGLRRDRHLGFFPLAGGHDEGRTFTALVGTDPFEQIEPADGMHVPVADDEIDLFIPLQNFRGGFPVHHGMNMLKTEPLDDAGFDLAGRSRIFHQ